MSLRRFIHKLFSTSPGRHADNVETRYDDVQIVNVADGNVIKGHAAVKAHFEREKQLSERYGSSIILQVYRMNLMASTIQGLQGEILSEIKVDGDFISGNDTVAAVKIKIRPLLEKEAGMSRERKAQPDFLIKPADQITLFFNGRPMQDEKLFYADHFILLPAWVQVFLHDCEFRMVAELATKMQTADQG